MPDLNAEMGMGKIAAAYDLGLNALMLRYNLRYYREFPWDRRAANGRGICDCLRWIIDDLLVLTPAGRPADSVRRIAEIAGHIQLLLVEGRLDDEGGIATNVEEPRAGIESFLAELSVLTKSTLRSRLKLYPWYRLGRSMARCYLDLLTMGEDDLLPSLRHVIGAVQNLSKQSRDRIEVLRILSLNGTSLHPLALLRKLIGEEANHDPISRDFQPIVKGDQTFAHPEPFSVRTPVAGDGNGARSSSDRRNKQRRNVGDNLPRAGQSQFVNEHVWRFDRKSFDKFVAQYEAENPVLAIMYKVRKLDQRIRDALEREQEAELDVFLDDRNTYAVYQGTPYPITYNQGLILEEVMAGEGELVKTAEIKKSHARLKSANFSREISRLNGDLRQLIRSKHRGGYCWVNNPLQTTTSNCRSSNVR